jgi:hypothetical protein
MSHVFILWFLTEKDCWLLRDSKTSCHLNLFLLAVFVVDVEIEFHCAAKAGLELEILLLSVRPVPPQRPGLFILESNELGNVLI